MVSENTADDVASLHNLPSLVAACFGALALFLTSVGICKVASLISTPNTPDPLQEAHVSQSKLKRDRSAGCRQQWAARTRTGSPPRSPREANHLSAQCSPPHRWWLVTPVKLWEVRCGVEDQSLDVARVPPDCLFVRHYLEAQNSPWERLGWVRINLIFICWICYLPNPLGHIKWIIITTSFPWDGFAELKWWTLLAFCKHSCCPKCKTGCDSHS